MLILEPLENRLLLTAVIENIDFGPITGVVSYDSLLFQPPEEAYTPEPADLKTGMYYEYYAGSWTSLVIADFDNTVPDSTGSDVNFNIAAGNNKGYRFLGYINIATSGLYTFYTESDDGSCLLIDDVEIVSNDGLHGMTEEAGSVNLDIGKHAIQVDFFNKTGGSGLVVSYDIPGPGGKAAIPDNVLYQDAPAPTIPDLAAGSDSGTSNSDNITTDTTPTFTAAAGTVPNDSTVYLRVNGVNKEAEVSADGSYAITLTNPLTEGIYDIDVFYIDNTGEIFGDSENLTITIDTSITTVTTPDLTPGTDSGISSTDNITQSATPTFTGYGDPGSTIQMKVGGTEKGASTTADASSGFWSVALAAGDFAAGANSVTVVSTDTAGNSSTSAALSVTYDATTTIVAATPDLEAGSDTGLADDDELTNDATPTFSGGVGAVEGDATVWLRIGSTNTRSTTAAADGSYSITLEEGDLAEGANTIDIIYIDEAGNTSADSGNLTVTLDTASAQPSAADLTSNATHDTGASQVDNITSNRNAQISGTAESNATAHIYVNGTEVNTTAVNGDGDWTYSFLNGDLTEGKNTITVTAVDRLNNAESVNSAALVITLDTILIMPGIPDLRAASDTGTNSDNITNDNTAWFDGYAEPGSSVQLFVGAAGKGTGTADSTTGLWSVQIADGDLAVGSNNITAKATDPAGNTATSFALGVTYDTSGTLPSAPLLLPASDTGSSTTDEITNDDTATIYGSVTDGNQTEANAVVHVRTNKNAAGWVEVGTTTADAAGNWTYTFDGIDDLAEGTNRVEIYIVDPALNTSANSSDLTLTLDTVIAGAVTPDLTATSDTGTDNTDDITAETRPTIQGNAGSVENSSTVHLWLDTPSTVDTEVDTVTAAADGSWSYTFTSSSPLEEGVNLIHIVAVDPAGNISAASTDLTVTISFDTGAELPPDLVAGSDTGTASNDDLTSDNTATIAGTCSAGADIKIRTNETNIITFRDNDGNDGDGVAGQWSYTFLDGVLHEGSNTVDFLTIDTANNTSDWSQDLVIDLDTAINQPGQPDLITAHDTGGSSGDDLTYNSTPTLTGVAEAGSTVTIDFNAGAHTGTVTASSSGTWSLNVTATWLNEGANTIFVSAVDPAGNASANSDHLIVTLDTTLTVPSSPDLSAATDTGSSSTDNRTSHSNPRLTGTADANTTIAVRLDPNGAVSTLGTTHTDGSGNWSYTLASTDLSEGANVLDVLCTDDAGNSSDSAELTITVETLISIPTALDLQSASDLGDSNSDDVTLEDAATITGSADASSTIYVRVNGTNVGSTTSDGVGDWSYTFDGVDDLIEGTNIIDAYAEDAVGNTSHYSDDLVVMLDRTISVPGVPDLTMGSDSGTVDTDNYTNIANSTLTGYCETNATVIISLNGNDTYATATDGDSDGQWSYTFAGGLIASSTGTANQIKVAQQDVAGNLSAYSSVLTVTLDDGAVTPSMADLAAGSDSGDLDTDDLSNITHVLISGVVEVNSSLQIFVDQGGGANLVDTIDENLLSSGAWNYTMSMGQLAEGSNSITIVATDKAGNVSAASPPLVIDLDTTVNQPGLPDLADGSDTGDNHDEVTSDDTPTFTGISDPDAHVTVCIDGEAVHTVDADGVGDWTYTFAEGEISNGAHRITVIATDIAGNISQVSEGLIVWLNVVPTRPAAPNLLSESDSGSITTDNLTRITTGTIAGKADANRSIEIYNDGNLIGDSISDHDGFWQYTFTTGQLAEGDNAITIITEDTFSGLKSLTSYPLTLTIDTTLPDSPLVDLKASSDTGTSDSDNYTSDETATVQGTTEPSALIDLYHNDSVITNLTATSSGNWSYTFAPGVMVEGNNDISIVITDVAGNVSAVSETLTVVLDIQQDAPETPVINANDDTGASNRDNLINNSTPDISGIVKPGSSVDIRVSGRSISTVQADDAGHWSYTLGEGELAEGVNHVEVVSTDPVGNVARSDALELTLDTTPPTLYNYFPAGVYEHTTQIIELYISGDDLDTLAATDTSGYVLTGSGGDGVFGNGNDWTIPIGSVVVDTLSGLVQLNTASTLTDDSYMLAITPSVSLLDQAGNAVVANFAAAQSIGETDHQPIIFSFGIDTAGPPAPTVPELDPVSDSGISATDRITNISSPLITTTADPALALEIICNGRSAGFANETSPGTYQLIIESSLIREGENLILARAFDGLSNCSDMSEILVVNYDSQPLNVAAIVVESLWLNDGPQQIYMVFDSNDIAPDSIGFGENYRLVASGGDGTYDDGNEIYITPSAYIYDTETQTAILSMPQTATGASELTPDDYRLTVLGDSQIMDLAGNLLVQAKSQDFKVVPAEEIHDTQSYVFTTDDHVTVKVSIIGQGDVQILLGESIDSDNTIERVVISNANENSVLQIMTSSPSADVTVGQILSDSPLKAIYAPHVDITEGIRADQYISRVTVDDIYDHAEINLVSSRQSDFSVDPALSVFADTIGRGVAIDIDGYVKTIRVQQCLADSITADSITSILVQSGDLASNIITTDGGLNKINVQKGGFTGDISVQGDIGRIFIKQAITDSTIQADNITYLYAESFDNLAVRANEAIKTIKTRSAQNSTISAVGTLSLFNVRGDCSSSTIAAGNDLLNVKVSGDSIDNLFLAGVDLGGDHLLDGINDSFDNGSIKSLSIGGTFLDSIASAGVSPGDDLMFFTNDDVAEFEGAISKVRFGKTSLDTTTSSDIFGLLAADLIKPFKVAGQTYLAPYQPEDEQFHILTFNPEATEQFLPSSGYVLPEMRHVDSSIANTYMPVEWVLLG
ncbi:MAG: hypothetical protein K9M57_00150 [Phycisphaerae bacterium]|nr:hypothetical protein [Phycisphaerae bacterium]